MAGKEPCPSSSCHLEGQLNQALLAQELLLFIAKSFLTLCNPGSGGHFLPQGIFPNPGIESMSPALAVGFFTSALPGKPYSGVDGSKLDFEFLASHSAWSLML